MNPNISASVEKKQNAVIATTVLPIGKLEVFVNSMKIVHFLLDNGNLSLNKMVYVAKLYLEDGTVKYGWTFSMFINECIIPECAEIDSVLINKRYKIWDAKTGRQLN